MKSGLWGDVGHSPPLKVRGCVHACVCVRAQFCQTLCDPMDCTFQALPSMGFSRQEYWSGLPFPSPGDLPNPEIEPRSPALQADSLPTKPLGKLICI